MKKIRYGFNSERKLNTARQKLIEELSQAQSKRDLDQSLPKLLQEDRSRGFSGISSKNTKDISHIRDKNKPKKKLSLALLPTDIDHLRKLFLGSEHNQIPTIRLAKSSVFLPCIREECLDQVLTSYEGCVHSSLPDTDDYERMDLGNPTGRQDILNLRKWFFYMKKKYMKQDLYSYNENAELIVSVCARELIRQVSVYCVQRGDLLRRILDIHEILLSRHKEYADKEITLMKERQAKEFADVVANLKEEIERLRKQVFVTNKELESQRKENDKAKENAAGAKKALAEFEKKYMEQENVWKVRYYQLLQKNRQSLSSKNQYKIVSSMNYKEVEEEQQQPIADAINDLAKKVTGKHARRSTSMGSRLWENCEELEDDLSGTLEAKLLGELMGMPNGNPKTIEKIVYRTLYEKGKETVKTTYGKETQTKKTPQKTRKIQVNLINGDGDLNSSQDNDDENALDMSGGGEFGYSDNSPISLNQSDQLKKARGNKNSVPKKTNKATSVDPNLVGESRNHHGASSDEDDAHNSNNSSHMYDKSYVGSSDSNLNNSLLSEAALKARKDKKAAEKQDKLKKSGKGKNMKGQINPKHIDPSLYSNLSTEGGILMEDGSVLLKDGRILLKDGNILLKDGTILSKDGKIISRDGKSKYKNLLKYSQNPNKQSNLKSLNGNSGNASELLMKLMNSGNIEDLDEFAKQIMNYLPEHIHRQSWIAGFSTGKEYGNGKGFKEGEEIGMETGYQRGFIDGMREAGRLMNLTEEQINELIQRSLGNSGQSGYLLEKQVSYKDEQQMNKRRNGGPKFTHRKNNKSLGEDPEYLNNKILNGSKFSHKVNGITKFCEFNFHNHHVEHAKKNNPAPKLLRTYYKVPFKKLEKNATMSRKLVNRLISQIYTTAMHKARVADEMLCEIAYDEFMQKYGLKTVAEKKFLEMVSSMMRYSDDLKSVAFLRMISGGETVGMSSYKPKTFVYYLSGLNFLLTSKIGIIIHYNESDDKQTCPTNRAVEFIKERTEFAKKETVASLLSSIEENSNPDPKHINDCGLVEMEFVLKLACDLYDSYLDSLSDILHLLNVAFNWSETINRNDILLILKHFKAKVTEDFDRETYSVNDLYDLFSEKFLLKLFDVEELFNKSSEEDSSSIKAETIEQIEHLKDPEKVEWQERVKRIEDGGDRDMEYFVWKIFHTALVFNQI